jgi:hypothetical protein
MASTTGPKSGAGGGGGGGGKKGKKGKKGGVAVTPALHDCAGCGAPEGTVPGVSAHKPCSRCRVTYYCSVKCQKKHWKEGGHKQHCVAVADRSVAKAVAAAKGAGCSGSSKGGGGGAAAEV